MIPRGFFISFEGCEGVGKSTNIAFLESCLEQHGFDIVTTREPGGTHLGEEIRSLLLRSRHEPIDSTAELLLMFAARAQHIFEVIEPALHQGKWVICDRFTDATYAYQCGGRGIQSDVVHTLELLVQQTLRPDFTILLDAPVEVGLSRARSRGELDRFEQESLDFFERVRAKYLDLASTGGGRYHVVDVSRPLDAVQHDVFEFARRLLSLWSERMTAL